MCLNHVAGHARDVTIFLKEWQVVYEHDSMAYRNEMVMNKMCRLCNTVPALRDCKNEGQGLIWCFLIEVIFFNT